jgi:sulfate transport system substrate-binding protein
MLTRTLARRRFLALGGAAGLAAILAACGDSDKDAEPASSGGSPAAAGGRRFEITNVSYDPTRELYAQYAGIFAKHYKETTGNTVKVNNSNGGSGSQARSVADGLDADVVTLALAGDTETLVPKGLIKSGWESKFPNNSNPYVSTIVLLVRKGNPKGIKDWSDLAKSGVGVITPNPKTSGGARWNFLAAWGSVVLNGGSEDQAKTLLGSIYKNVLVLDSGARGSTQTFVDKSIGDVLLAWENEALLTLRDSKDFEIVYPSQSILAEPAVAVVDSIVDKRGTREVATEFLNHLYSDEGQELIAKNFYRPSNEKILAKYKTQYPDFQKKVITIRDFNGWAAVGTKFFAEGAIFDQIYKP